jgi:hypothetical protein
MVEKFEKNLYNFFDEIIYVNSNPAIVQTQIIEKVDGEIKSKFIRDSYDLHTISICTKTSNLFDTECKSSGIIERIKNLCQSISVDFYPKNIIQRLFYNKTKNLHKCLSEFSTTEYFLITTTDIKSFIPTEFNTFYIDGLDNNDEKRLKNKIIIAKKSKIVINKNVELDSEKVRVEFWINSENYKVINLN